MNPFKLWWHWFGPDSPFGPTIGGLLTVCQIAAVAFFVAWLLTS